MVKEMIKNSLYYSTLHHLFIFFTQRKLSSAWQMIQPMDQNWQPVSCGQNQAIISVIDIIKTSSEPESVSIMWTAQWEYCVAEDLLALYL